MAARIVDVPDASKVLNASIVTYANEAKMKYANVSKDTLKQYGAVSENTAREMAEGVAKANNADVAAGISGIAGPTGGTEDKPVGMVCFGFYIDGKVFLTQNISEILEETMLGTKALSMFWMC